MRISKIDAPELFTVIGERNPNVRPYFEIAILQGDGCGLLHYRITLAQDESLLAHQAHMADSSALARALRFALLREAACGVAGVAALRFYWEGIPIIYRRYQFLNHQTFVPIF